MTPNTEPRPPGPVVDIWIEDTPTGQALFVTTTNTTGHQTTAAIWQPNTQDQPNDGARGSPWTS